MHLSGPARLNKPQIWWPLARYKQSLTAASGVSGSIISKYRHSLCLPVDLATEFLPSAGSKLTRCQAEEEKAADAVARAKEAEEQAALPYKWTQTIGDLDITIEVPGNLKGKDFIVEIKKTKVVVGIKGQEPILSASGILFVS